MTVQILYLLLVFASGFQSSGGIEEAIRLYEKGEFRQAVNSLFELSRISPATPDIRLWLGKAYLKTHEWDNAVREMEKAVQLEPSNALYHLWLGRACGARASHSVFFMAVRWAGRVMKEFEAATRLSPDNLDARFDLLDFYLNAPGILGGGGDKAEAQAKAITKFDSKRGYVARAMIFEKNKNWDMAKKELIQATIDYPNDADSHKDLADFLVVRKDFESALAHAQKALALDKESKRATLICAAAKIRKRADLEEAEVALRALAAGQLRDEDPTFEEIHYWLGECYFAKGERAKAHEAFKSALAFNPEYQPAKDGISKLRQPGEYAGN